MHTGVRNSIETSGEIVILALSRRQYVLSRI